MKETHQDWPRVLDEVGLQIQLAMTPVLRQQIESGIVPFAQRCNHRDNAIQRAKDAKKAHFEKVKREPDLQESNYRAPHADWEWDYSYLAEIVCQPPVSKIAYVEDGREQEYDCERYSCWLMPARLGKDLMATLDENADRQAIAIVESQLCTLASEQMAQDWIVVPRQWWTYLEIPKSQVVGCWRPTLDPIPPDPCEDWLLSSLRGPIAIGRLGDEELHIPHGAIDRTAVPPLADEACEMERNYVIVAALHDRVNHTEQISAGVWPSELLLKVIASLEQGWGHGLTERFIKSAWIVVHQSVPKRPDRPPRKAGPGRKRLSSKEAARRQSLKVAWEQARDCGVPKADFCADNGCGVADLDKVLDWARRQ